MSGALSTSLCVSPPNSQQTNSESAATKPRSLLHKHPLYAPTTNNLSLQFKEKILCLEIMGIDTGKALSLNPSLHTASLDSIHAIVSFLQSKGIHQKDLPRIFGMCPKILTSTITTDLVPVFEFLFRDLGVPKHKLRRVINKCPRLLVCCVQEQLKPALSYLKKLGFRDMTALACQDPVLLVSNVEHTLIPKLKFLEGIGFDELEAKSMVLRCPGLFTFSLENNFKPKYEYFRDEMNGTLEELRGFPQFFAFSLEKRIQPRHLEVRDSGVLLPLSLMLKSTDEEFQELLKKAHNQYSNS